VPGGAWSPVEPGSPCGLVAKFFELICVARCSGVSQRVSECFTGTLQLRKGNNLFGLQRAVNRESSRQSKKGKEQDNETGRAGNKKAAEGMQSPNRSNDRAQ
jgi:hypothetical protein